MNERENHHHDNPDTEPEVEWVSTAPEDTAGAKPLATAEQKQLAGLALKFTESGTEAKDHQSIEYCLNKFAAESGWMTSMLCQAIDSADDNDKIDYTSLVEQLDATCNALMNFYWALVGDRDDMTPGDLYLSLKTTLQHEFDKRYELLSDLTNGDHRIKRVDDEVLDQAIGFLFVDIDSNDFDDDSENDDTEDEPMRLVEITENGELMTDEYRALAHGEMVSVLEIVDEVRLTERLAESTHKQDLILSRQEEILEQLAESTRKQEEILRQLAALRETHELPEKDES